MTSTNKNTLLKTTLATIKELQDIDLRAWCTLLAVMIGRESAMDTNFGGSWWRKVKRS